MQTNFQFSIAAAVFLVREEDGKLLGQMQWPQ
jgi:hypothetical protein